MTYVPETYLMHYGVKGQKWGVRRYQNYDGTLIHPKQKKTISPEEKEARNKKIKKAVIIGAAVIGTAALAYGGYRYASISNEATNYAKREAGRYFTNSLFIRKPTVDEISELRDIYNPSVERLKSDYINQRKRAIKSSGKFASDVYSRARKDYIDAAKTGVTLKPKSSYVAQPLDDVLKGWDPTEIEKLYNMRK